MPPKKLETKWTSWDDEQLAKLQGIIGAISQARFSLQTLQGSWQQMPDDEVDPIVEQLVEAHQDLGEIYETLEELANG